MSEGVNNGSDPAVEQLEVELHGLPTPGLLAENIVVQYTPGHFIMTFFQLQHPIQTPNMKTHAGPLDLMTVGKILVTPDKMGEFIEVLLGSYGRYQTTVNKGITEEEGKGSEPHPETET
jgi:hypothetical protein